MRVLHETTQELANWQYYFAIAVFLITYAIIISEKINRAVIALLGAALMVIMGSLIYTTPLRNILNGDDYTTHRYDDFGEHYE